MKLGLGVVLRVLAARRCGVCRQIIDTQQQDDDRLHVFMCGAIPFAQCPCCQQIVSNYTDPAYRRRVRRFEMRQRRG